MRTVRPSSHPEPGALRSLRLPVLLATICLLANAALQPRFLDVVNPDAISYVSIARKILAGNPHDAVNAYWGPLLSWLLVPLLAAGLDPLVAARALMGATCVTACLAAWKLSSRFALAPWLRATLLLAMLPSLLNVACRDVTPDMLIVTFLLLYLDQSMRADFGRSPWHGVACGLLGGLAYLSKAYGFYFFLAHFTAVCTLLIVGGESSRERARLARTAAAGLVAFAAVSGLWIAALGAKYDRVMVSATGPYNLALAAPGSSGHPTHRLGFLPPPNGTAVSAWEDPSFLPLPRSLPPEAGEVRPGRLAYAARTLKDILDLAIGYCPLTPAILVVALGLSAARFLWRRRLGPPRPGLWIPLLALLIYCAGYAWVLVEWRYVFLVSILLPLMGAEMVWVEGRAWRERARARGPRRQLAATVVGVSVLALLLVPLVRKPAKQLRRYYENDFGVTAPQVACRLRDVVPAGARMASNGDWGTSLATAFLLDGRYYGERGDLPLDAVLLSLRDHRVTHYLVWRETPAEAAAMRGHATALRGRVENLVVYVLEPDARLNLHSGLTPHRKTRTFLTADWAPASSLAK